MMATTGRLAGGAIETAYARPATRMMIAMGNMAVRTLPNAGSRTQPDRAPFRRVARFPLHIICALIICTHMFKLALATVSVAALLFTWGGVVFVLVLKNYIPRTLGHLFRPAADTKVGWIVVEKLAQSFVLVLLYRQMMPVNPLVFGALTGALLQLTYV